MIQPFCLPWKYRPSFKIISFLLFKNIFISITYMHHKQGLWHINCTFNQMSCGGMRGVVMTEAISPNSRETCILIVDDDPILLKLWIRLSKDFPKHQFNIFNSSQTALLAIQGGHIKPDILLTDVIMPEMDGLELISNVQSFNASMKTIATTTHTRNEKQFQGIAPFVHVIKKPYKNLDNLRELLLIFLEQQSILEDVEKNEQQGVFVWDL